MSSTPLRLGLLVLLAASVLAADEIVLLNGRKISGTVVGVDKDSFRVETDFGIALVRKDKIVRIEITQPQRAEKPPTPAAKRASDSPSPLSAPPTTAAVTARPSLAIRERRPPGGHIQEHVEGSTYVNDSFGFELFKPPTWRILEGTVRNIPSAVAALGTEDEATLLLVGSVLFDGPPSAYAAVLDSALRRLYSEYERESDEQTLVAGRPAIRRRFHGLAQGREWHGVAVNLADGPVHYGIVGVTSEEVYQFKESVMGKMIGSLRFR